MASKLTKRGKYYYFTYDEGKDENGERVQRQYNTKTDNYKEAQKIQRELLSSLDNGTYVKKVKQTFSEFILQWLEDDIKINCESTTYESYKQTINKHVVPYFKNKELQELKPIDLQQFYKSLLDKGLSANTVKHHHANIHKCLKYALRMGIVSRNISEAAILPKVEKFEANFYDGKKIEKLLKAVEGTYIEVPATITIALGLRRGEVLGLKWDYVNLEAKEIYIYNNRVRSGKNIIDKTPKTKSSRRTLIIPDYLVDYLKSVQLKQKQNKDWFFKDSYQDNGYVCCNSDGTPLGVTYISRAFKEVLEVNGLPHIRFHDLRHSNASYLLKQGVTIKQIQEWLGHSNPSITIGLYAHTDAEMKKDTAKKVNNMFKKMIRSK